MLINFSIENWMSFRDVTTFTMIASRERQHRDRVAAIKKYSTRALPIAAIYGGNASGKTNFISALKFAQFFIIDGTKVDQKIPVVPFKLEAEYNDRPTCFKFEILVENSIYEYSFSVTKSKVVEETLIKVTKADEIELYNRKKSHIDSSFKQTQRLNFVLAGTRDNQLFLTNSVSQNLTEFRNIYDWFKSTLVILGPDSSRHHLGSRAISDPQYHRLFNNVLGMLDTGMTRVDYAETPIEQLGFSDSVLSFLEQVNDGEARLLPDFKRRLMIEVRKKDGKWIGLKPESYHVNRLGQEVKFDLSEESSGSQRAVDFVPMICDLCASGGNRVYIVDELDRSLHTVLTRALITLYLSNCDHNSRTQLIFSTHDVLLIDQSLLRRDEIWVTERDSYGMSTIFPFSKYKDIRYDKDIRKSYLTGRLGGLPAILLSDCISDIRQTGKEK